MANLTQRIDSLVLEIRNRLQSAKIASVMEATGLSQSSIYDQRAGRRLCDVATLRKFAQYFDEKAGGQPAEVTADILDSPCPAPWEEL